MVPAPPCAEDLAIFSMKILAYVRRPFPKKNKKKHWQFGGQLVTLLWIYVYVYLYLYLYLYLYNINYISICVHVYSCMHRAYKSLGHTFMYTAIIAYRKRIVRQNSLSPQATCVPCWLLKSRLSW